MTRKEFEEGYAKRSGLTVTRLHELGQRAQPCACGADNCKGWAMVGDGGLARHKELYGPVKEDDDD